MAKTQGKTGRFRLPPGAAWRQAGAGGRRVPFGGAALRPDERPDVGRPAPRLEGGAGHGGQSAAKGGHGRSPLLDLAGGTGDIAFRVADAGGPGTRVTVADINAEMLAVGRERAAEAGRDDVDLHRGQRRGAAVARPRFDAVTIAFGIRNVPRIDVALAEAHRVLRIGGHFLCLEFSSVDVPGLDRLYDLYSFNVIPAIGRAVTGDAEAYRYLVESIRKFPRPEHSPT